MSKEFEPVIVAALQTTQVGTPQAWRADGDVD